MPGKRRKWREFADSLVERSADVGRMDLEGAMAEDVKGHALFKPCRKLLRPTVEKRFVHFHAWMSNIAHEGEVRCGGEYDGEVGFALASLEDLYLFSGTNSDGPTIHNDSRDVVPTEECI